MKKIFVFLGASLLALAIVLVVRAALFTLEQPPVDPLPPIPIDANAAAERLAAAIRVQTISHGEAPHRDPAAFEELHALLRKSYPLAHTQLSTEAIGLSLLYTWNGTDSNKKPILLMAHQDVVPVDDEAGWKHPPFSGAIAEGYVWGRGALDVKSGMIGILEAVELLLAEGFRPSRTIVLAFGHDEELGGREGAAEIAKLLSQRNVRFDMVLDEGSAIVEGLIPDVSVPAALIGVAEKGYVSAELVASVEGGHSAMPPGETAIGLVSAAVARLQENPFPPQMNQSVRFFDFVGPKMPFTKRIVFGNMWLFQPLVADILSKKPATAASIRTTTAPTIFHSGVKDNVLPHRASAVVNFRIIPGETPETVLARVKEVVDDSRIEVRRYSEWSWPPSPISSIDSDGYRGLAETVRRVYPDPELIVAPSLVLGATDSRWFQPLSDNVYRLLFNRIGPEDLARIHGNDERIGLENHALAIRFYHQLMMRLQ